MPKAPVIDESLVFEVCHRFLADESPVDIAQWLDGEVEGNITREAIYPLIRRAKRDGYFRLVAPEHVTLNQRISDFFKTPLDRIHISNVRTGLAREYVADRAAHAVVDLIENVATKKQRVGLGLGGGGTVARIARNIAFLLQNESIVQYLAVHTLTGGIDPAMPLHAPNSFLSFFDGSVTDTYYQGLFTPPVVAASAKEYREVVDGPGIAESFERAKQIDIVITSIACAADEHGELNRLMTLADALEERGGETVAALKNEGWVGDALYRPFSTTQPIVSEQGVRAVSLFELKDLCDMAKKPNKHVVVAVTPCHQCGQPKTAALAPLLSEESLRIWNHLFLDVETARTLVPAVG